MFDSRVTADDIFILVPANGDRVQVGDTIAPVLNPARLLCDGRATDTSVDRIVAHEGMFFRPVSQFIQIIAPGTKHPQNGKTLREG